MSVGTKRCRKVNEQMISRKIIAVAAVASLSVLGLAGCSPASSGTSAPKAGGLIAVITPSPENPFFKAESDAAAAEAVKLGYKTTVSSHDDDANKQSDLIDAAITAGAKAIILDNAGADDSIGAIQKATDAGIGVFLVDREINKAGIAKAQIVSNNAQGAALVAEAFVAALPDGGNYFELTGKATDTNAGVRSDGYASVISQHPNLVSVAKQTANWSQDEAFSVVETMLQAHPEVKGIIAGNDTMALGAVAAVDAAGLTGKVVIAGFDGSPDAVAAIKAGKMLATSLQPVVLLSQLAVQQADKFIRTGKSGAAEKQSIDCVLIDKSNIDKYTLFGLKD
jgi:erythritol transport system substrate-binding protein